MQTSSYLKSDHRAITGHQRSAGFTLIEILVVLVIVSIMTGVVVANMPSFARDSDFITESSRLKTLLEMARDEALVQSVELGFKPGKDEYEFFVYNDSTQKWDVYGNRPFQARQLPANISLRVYLKTSDFFPKGAVDDESPSEAPPILLTSSGEMTPFELRISMNDLSRTLVSDGFSNIEWQDELDAQQED